MSNSLLSKNLEGILLVWLTKLIFLSLKLKTKKRKVYFQLKLFFHCSKLSRSFLEQNWNENEAVGQNFGFCVNIRDFILVVFSKVDPRSRRCFGGRCLRKKKAGAQQSSEQSTAEVLSNLTNLNDKIAPNYAHIVLLQLSLSLSHTHIPTLAHQISLNTYTFYPGPGAESRSFVFHVY